SVLSGRTTANSACSMKVASCVNSSARSPTTTFASPTARLSLLLLDRRRGPVDRPPLHVEPDPAAAPGLAAGPLDHLREVSGLARRPDVEVAGGPSRATGVHPDHRVPGRHPALGVH